MENVKYINKILKSKYGCALDGPAKFRVAWSEDLFEVRKGLFSELAIYEEVRRVPKYSYIKDKFVLEVYTRAFPNMFGSAIVDAERIVLESDFYEPLRVFKTRDGKYLPPNLEVCEAICNAFAELINRPVSQRLTEKIAASQEVEQVDKEVKTFFNILTMSDSDLLQSLRAKETIILPGIEVN